jgi:hypothetical protein
MRLAILFLGLAIFLPNIVLAAPADFAGLVSAIIGVVKSFVPLLFGVAVLIFFWGMAKFVLNSGDEAGVAEGKQTMFYGLVGLFVMFSIWGIIRIIEATFF